MQAGEGGARELAKQHGRYVRIRSETLTRVKYYGTRFVLLIKWEDRYVELVGSGSTALGEHDAIDNFSIICARVRCIGARNGACTTVHEFPDKRRLVDTPAAVAGVKPSIVEGTVRRKCIVSPARISSFCIATSAIYNVDRVRMVMHQS